MQSNVPYVSPTDELIDLEFTSGENPKPPPQASNPPTSEYEISEEVLLTTDAANVADAPMVSSV